MIIFLDFDGVTHPYSWGGEDFVQYNLDQLRIAFDEVERIIGERVDIVISSDWRLSNNMDAMISYLRHGGFSHRVIGATPDLSMPSAGMYQSGVQKAGIRHRECMKWMHDNNLLGDDWVAIDDNKSLFTDRTPLLWVDDSLGFTESDGSLLIKIAQTGVDCYFDSERSSQGGRPGIIF